mmetsp:Transcript_88728/g.224168  ORF Transcript_88728/g.224168 Transcript_88728/m.224168 type:complete len:214 (-) Transcript_88728:105-746(-)
MAGFSLTAVFAAAFAPTIAMCAEASGFLQQQPRTCQIGEYVNCFQGNPGMCRGDQCCLAKSGQTWTCPSASVDHAPQCDLGKAYDCTPKCDMSRCDGCSGSICENCREEEQVNCCMNSKCHGCSGQQCDLCRQDHLGECCEGKSPAVGMCHKATTPPPTCQVGQSVDCFQGNPGTCAGDECCVARSGQTWTCPSASVNHESRCDLPKAYDCTV